MNTTVSLELEIKTCPVCGVTYGVPLYWSQKKLEDGSQWFCPNGHNLVFTHPASKKIAELERQLAQYKRETIRSAALAAENRSLKDELRKLKETPKTKIPKVANGSGLNGLDPTIKTILRNAGIAHKEQVEAMTDEQLLGVQGMGQTRLEKVREYFKPKTESKPIKDERLETLASILGSHRAIALESLEKKMGMGQDELLPLLEQVGQPYSEGFWQRKQAEA